MQLAGPPGSRRQLVRNRRRLLVRLDDGGSFRLLLGGCRDRRWSDTLPVVQPFAGRQLPDGSAEPLVDDDGASVLAQLRGHDRGGAFEGEHLGGRVAAHADDGPGACLLYTPRCV